jgi:branched-subunit amino acid transport protein
MNLLLAVLLVGLVSYLLRALPLILADRVRSSPAVEKVLDHAAQAALTALLVGMVAQTSIGRHGSGTTSAPFWAAIGVAVVSATLKHTMLRVVVLALTGYWFVTLLLWAAR